MKVLSTANLDCIGCDIRFLPKWASFDGCKIVLYEDKPRVKNGSIDKVFRESKSRCIVNVEPFLISEPLIIEISEFKSIKDIVSRITELSEPLKIEASNKEEFLSKINRELWNL